MFLQLPQLGGQAVLVHLDQAGARLEDGGQPAGCLEAEGGRHRLLEEGTGGHRRRTVCVGERGTRGGDRLQLAENQPERTAGDEHGGRVRDVLAGRSPVDVLGAGTADHVAKRSHERLCGVADRAALLRKRDRVEELDAAATGDALGRIRRDHTCPSRRPGEGSFGLEHRLHPRPVRHRLAQLGRDEEGVERAHRAKNAVCPSPCRWMSKRSPSSTA